MEVLSAIHELRSSLEHLTSEENLLTALGRGLASLRAAFPAHREEFTPANIEFLRGLEPIFEALRRFVLLKGDLPAIARLGEYESALDQLVAIRDALAGLPVASRPAKEIGDLIARLPAIRANEFAHRNFRFHSGAPAYPMSLRQGPQAQSSLAAR
jgi:hypothetical protein